MSNSKTLQHSVSRFCNCAEAQVLYYVDRVNKQKMAERTIEYKNPISSFACRLTGGTGTDYV